jgi:hypothetical protein
VADRMETVSSGVRMRLFACVAILNPDVILKNPTLHH